MVIILGELTCQKKKYDNYRTYPFNKQTYINEEDLKNLASRLSWLCGVDSMLSEATRRHALAKILELVVKNRISKDEVQRNVKVCKFDLESPVQRLKNMIASHVVPEQFYENGDAPLSCCLYYDAKKKSGTMIRCTVLSRKEKSTRDNNFKR